MCCATFRFWADSDIPDSARRRNLCSPSRERSILLMYIRIRVRTVTELHAEAFDDIAECAAVRANAPLTEGRIHAPAARNKDVRGLRQVWPLLLPGRVVNHGTERCISFGGLRADQAVAAEILRVLKNGWASMRSCSLSSAA
jgi:hypothetical protein